jgi:hypothetical protein
MGSADPLQGVAATALAVAAIRAEETSRESAICLCSPGVEEAISMAMGIAVKQGLAVLEPDPAASRGQVARLTLGGRRAQDGCRRLLAAIEDGWQERFGSAAIRGIRQVIERLADAPDGQPSPLWLGLEPYPGGWRASVRRPRTLPHFPMVLHRGGFPDGS